ncbi:MAG: putative toxin-antitoxin system toxin component, PIN family [Cyanobacteria bacterium P01_F01_bin.143]
MIKVIIDTSVFVAALLSKNQTNAPAQIINAWREEKFILVMAPPLMRELVVKLIQKNIPLTEIENLVAIIGEIALQIPGIYEASRLDDIDPDDNMFLAAAYESNADYLVSLDKKHLLPQQFQIRNVAKDTEIMLFIFRS